MLVKVKRYWLHLQVTDKQIFSSCSEKLEYHETHGQRGQRHQEEFPAGVIYMCQPWAATYGPVLQTIWPSRGCATSPETQEHKWDLGTHVWVHVGMLGPSPFFLRLTMKWLWAWGGRNAPRLCAGLHWEPAGYKQWWKHISSEVSQLWLRVRHKARGLSEPLYQQLLFHFPSAQAHFLSLVHRDYSSSNQNREKKAPQNTRGTKLYKG